MIDVLIEGILYIFNHLSEFYHLLGEHLLLVFVGETAAILTAVPVGILATRNDTLRNYAMAIGNIFHTVPPLAVIALVFPLVGIGRPAGYVALWVYGLLPILLNTVTGISEVSDDVIKSAKGMGMTDNQILRKIQLPLAIPVIFAGIRTSTVINVGNAYLAFFIGAGGFGDWVIAGINMFNNPQIIAGALPGAVLAVLLDIGLSKVQTRLGGDSAGRTDVQAA